MRLLRLAFVFVAMAGCNTPPSVVRTDGAVDGDADAQSHDGTAGSGGHGGGTAGSGGHGGGTAGSGGHGGGTTGSAGQGGGAGGQGSGVAGSGGHAGGANDASADGEDGAAPLVGTPVATFDASLDGFVLSAYHDTDQLNLGDPAAGLAVPPTLTWDGVVGSPTAGSMKVTAPYSGANQYVDIQKALGTANVQDWAGKKLHVRLRVDTGSSFSGVAQLYVDTTVAYVFGGTAFNVAAGSNWQEFVLEVGDPMSTVTGYDPTEIVLFGLQLNTGSAGTGATATTFHIDSFTIE